MIDRRLKLFEDNLLPPPRPAGRHFVLLEALLLLELVGVHTRSSRRGRGGIGIGRLGDNRYESRGFGDGRKDGGNRRGVGDGRRAECLLGMALKTDDRRGEFAVAMECALEETWFVGCENGTSKCERNYGTVMSAYSGVSRVESTRWNEIREAHIS